MEYNLRNVRTVNVGNLRLVNLMSVVGQDSSGRDLLSFGNGLISTSKHGFVQSRSCLINLIEFV